MARERSEIHKKTNKPNAITNHTTIRSIQLKDKDGQEESHDISKTISSPDDQGGYVDKEEVSLAFDQSGNPVLPEMGNLVRSHSGIIFEPNQENHAYCAMAWHKDPNNHVYLGQDGGVLPNGTPACGPCIEKYRRYKFALWALGLSTGLGTVIGLFIAGWRG